MAPWVLISCVQVLLHLLPPRSRQPCCPAPRAPTLQAFERSRRREIPPSAVAESGVHRDQLDSVHNGLSEGGIGPATSPRHRRKYARRCAGRAHLESGAYLILAAHGQASRTAPFSALLITPGRSPSPR